MAKYRVTTPSYLPRAPGGTPELIAEGEIIDFEPIGKDGTVGFNLSLVKGGADKAAELKALREDAEKLGVEVTDDMKEDDIRTAITLKLANP